MLWESSNSTSPCNGTSFLFSQETNVLVLALIYYSIWVSFVYAHSVEAKLLFCSTEQFLKATFLKLSRTILNLSFSLSTNLLYQRAAPLCCGSRHFQCCLCCSQELSHRDSKWLLKGSSSNPKLHFEHEFMAVLCLNPPTCPKEPTLCISTLYFLDAKKVVVSAVWFSPTMQAGRKPGMMPCHKEDSGVSRQGRCRMGVRGLLPPCPAVRLVHISLHTQCRHASCCFSLTPSSDETKHWALLEFASIKQSVLTFPLKGMPDVFGLHLGNLQRQQLQREHTAHVLHAPAKCICHKAQGLLNFSDRLRQKKK